MERKELTGQMGMSSTLRARLLENGKETIRCRILRYQFPEETLIFYLRNRRGVDVQVVDLYAQDTKLRVDGQPVSLRYQGTGFEIKAKHESVFFELTKDPSD